MNKSPWSFFGERPKRPAPGWTALVLAFIFASQTFIAPTDPYPVYMIAIAILGSAWMVYLGIQKRALLAFAFLPAAAMFLAPLTGFDPFTSFTPLMFSAHALIALCFGLAGYSFTATERREK